MSRLSQGGSSSGGGGGGGFAPAFIESALVIPLVDDPVSALGPDWHVDARLSAVTPSTGLALGLIADAQGSDAPVAERLLGVSGLPSAGPSLTGTEDVGKAMAIMPANAWTGLHGLGLFSTLAASAWPTTGKMKVTWRGFLPHIGMRPPSAPEESGFDFTEMAIARNYTGFYSFLEIGVIRRGPGHSFSPDGTAPGVYLYYEFTLADLVDRKCYSIDPLDESTTPYLDHIGEVLYDPIAGTIVATINGIDIPMEYRDADSLVQPLPSDPDGWAQPPETSDEDGQLNVGRNGWSLDYFRITNEDDSTAYHVFDVAGASEGDISITTDTDTWGIIGTAGGGQILAPFDGPRILGNGTVAGHALNDHTLSNVGIDDDFTFITRVRPWGGDYPRVVCDLNIAGLFAGFQAGWGLGDLQIFSGPAWGVILSDGAGHVLMAGGSTLPTEMITTGFRIDRDAGHLSYLENGVVIQTVDLGDFGAMAPNAPLDLLANQAPGDMIWAALWRRAITDDEMTTLTPRIFVPAPPTSGAFTLTSTDGVTDWVSS